MGTIYLHINIYLVPYVVQRVHTTRTAAETLSAEFIASVYFRFVSFFLFPNKSGVRDKPDRVYNNDLEKCRCLPVRTSAAARCIRQLT